MLHKFIHESYAGEWYNGQQEQTPEYIGNKVSILIGMPRLRQLRIQEGKLSFVRRFLLGSAKLKSGSLILLKLISEHGAIQYEIKQIVKVCSSPCYLLYKLMGLGEI